MRLFGCTAGLAMAGFATSFAVAAPTFVSFDVPKSVQTLPRAINATNDVIGDWWDGQTYPAGWHGFLRSANGTITSFDFPGAALTFVTAINGAGTIAGWYEDSSGRDHGYVRFADGSFATVDPPGSIGTQTAAINDRGRVLGNFSDATGSHGFVRLPNGHFRIIDAAADSHATDADGLNKAGSAVGYYVFYSGGGWATNGFVRLSTGAIEPFSVSGAVCTWGLTINDTGWLAGGYSVAQDCSGEQGFVRDPQGQFAAFQPKDAVNTYVFSLNNDGYATGYDVDANGRHRGFVRKPDGKVVRLDDPDAGLGKYQGTEPSSINNSRWVTGSYTDANNVPHGFIVRARK